MKRVDESKEGFDYHTITCHRNVRYNSYKVSLRYPMWKSNLLANLPTCMLRCLMHCYSSLADTFKSCADAKSIYPEGGPNYWIKTEGSKQAAYKNCK